MTMKLGLQESLEGLSIIWDRMLKLKNNEKFYFW